MSKIKAEMSKNIRAEDKNTLAKNRSLRDLAKGARVFDEAYREISDFLNNSDNSDNTAYISSLLNGAEENIDTSNPLWDILLLNGRRNFACIVVEDRKMIVAANEIATDYFDFTIGPLPADITLPSNEEPCGSTESSGEINSINWMSNHLGREIQILTFPKNLYNSTGTKEIFVLHDSSQFQSLETFAAKHDITSSEQSILEAFLDGMTMDEIAEQRFRSINTVKTQFYTLLRKCGCSNQLQLLQAFDAHVRQENLENQIFSRMNNSGKNEFTILGRHGRKIEFQRQGSKDGRLVILLRADYVWCLPRRYEAPLREAGIQYMCLSPPGCGRTCPPLPGQTHEEACAEDIAVLLDVIGQDDAVLHCVGNKVVLGLRIANALPSKVRSLVITFILAPINRRKYEKNSSWLATAGDIFIKRTPFPLDWIAKTYSIFMMKLGVRRFLTNFSNHDKPGLEALLELEVLNSIQTAWAATIAHGLDVHAREIRLAVLEDWEDDLAKCPVPVHIRLGELDVSGPMPAVESLATDYPDKVFLSTVSGYGMSYIFQTIDPLVELFIQATCDDKEHAANPKHGSANGREMA